MSRRWHLRRVKVREEALDEGEDEDVPRKDEEVSRKCLGSVYSANVEQPMKW